MMAGLKQENKVFSFTAIRDITCPYMILINALNK